MGTLIFVQWFKRFAVVVEQEIGSVYRTLKLEGADIKVFKIPPTGDEVEITNEEVEKINQEEGHAHQTTYHCELDFYKSKISGERFYQVILNWGYELREEFEDD
jgi:hypothetical protein